MSKIFDQEIMMLTGVINALQQLQVVGPFQGAKLAQVHDGIVAVINNMKTKAKGPTEGEKVNAPEVSAADFAEVVQVMNGAQ